MTPSQRAAALRLVDNMNLSLETWIEQAENLLRELAAEPDDVPELVKVRRQLFAAEPVVTECADNDSPWLVCKTCAAAGKCAKEAEPVQEPVAWGVFVDDELFKPFNCKDQAVDWFQAQYNHGSRYDFLVLPLYTAPQQRKPLKTAMEAEIECDCLVAWNASTYGHSAHDTVHPMFLSAFIRGYRAAERAHGITGEPT